MQDRIFFYFLVNFILNIFIKKACIQSDPYIYNYNEYSQLSKNGTLDKWNQFRLFFLGFRLTFLSYFIRISGTFDKWNHLFLLPLHNSNEFQFPWCVFELQRVYCVILCDSPQTFRQITFVLILFHLFGATLNSTTLYLEYLYLESLYGHSRLS